MLCRAPSIFQTRSLPAFSLSSGKLWWFFLTKNVLPILLISPYDVISFLHPFGQQDKRNGRWRKIEEAEEMMALRARYHFNPRVPSGTDKTRNKTEEKQEITFLNNFSLFLLHSLLVLLLSKKILKRLSCKNYITKFAQIILCQRFHVYSSDWILHVVIPLSDWQFSSDNQSYMTVLKWTW